MEGVLNLSFELDFFFVTICFVEIIGFMFLVISVYYTNMDSTLNPNPTLL